MFGKNVKKIYMIGIKGVGMTMLAQYLEKKGFEIEGSDTGEKYMTDEVLKGAGIKIHEGFSPENLVDPFDLYVYSTAYNENNNVELAELKNRGKKFLTYAEALGEAFANQFGIAVVGSHGKTTTTAWLGFVLERAGKSPNVMVGARVPQFKGSSLNGYSDLLVVEADEYQNKLKYFQPQAVLLNNIDYDHPDFFPTREDYAGVFVEFIKRIPKKGFLVANFDDPVVRRLAPVNTRAKLISYGITSAADFVAYDLRQEGGKQFFKVKLGQSFAGGEDYALSDSELGEFSTALSGRHNVYNALAVIASALELGVALHEVRTYLEEFSGCARRMEFLGEFRQALIIDDYAHHPAEVKTTLEAAGKKYPGRKLRVVFHPHTFTRTKSLLDDFAKSFQAADEVIVLDIYGSAREQQGGVHSRGLVDLIGIRNQESGIRQAVKYIPTLEAVEEYLRESVLPNDLILLMGAGDVFRIGERLLS